MKFLNHVFAILVLLTWANFINAQIKWSVVSDTITLTPNSFIGNGYINIKKGKLSSIHVDGTIGIDMKEKYIYFNDGTNVFQFETDQLSDIKLNEYGHFFEDDLFKKSFFDSLFQHYRRLIYQDLELNEIAFSFSKRVEYEVRNDGLFLKNQRKINGKICYVDLDNIIIVNENGKLEKLKDGDFNFLQIGMFKTFTCKGLYDYLFRNFEKELNDNINKWEENIKKDNIESLISVFGPFNNITSISADKKMITWKKAKPVYYLNLSTNSRSFSYTTNRYLSNITSNSASFLYKISPFFIYGNSYRNTDISLSGTNTNIATAQTNQSGSIIYNDEGSTFTIIQDLNNKTTQVYHENIFSEPQYGKPFRFISF